MLIFWMLVHPVLSLTYLIEEKRWGFVALFSVIYLILGTRLFVLLLYLLSFLAGVISNVYVANQKAIESIVFITLCFVALIYYMKQRRHPKEPPKPTTAVDPQTAQYNYEVLRKVLFNILLEISDVVGVKCPKSLSELDTPNHYTEQGGIVFFNFVATKQNDVDAKAARQLIQNRINQKLLAMEIPEIAQATVLFCGTAHPSISADKVSQTGVLIQIDLVLTNKHYCELLRNRRYQEFEKNRYECSARDHDF